MIPLPAAQGSRCRAGTARKGEPIGIGEVGAKPKRDTDRTVVAFSSDPHVEGAAVSNFVAYVQFAMFGVGSDLRGLLHGARCAEAAVADDDAARVHHATDEGMRWAAFRN